MAIHPLTRVVSDLFIDPGLQKDPVRALFKARSDLKGLNGPDYSALRAILKRLFKKNIRPRDFISIVNNYLTVKTLLEMTSDMVVFNTVKIQNDLRSPSVRFVASPLAER